MINLQGVNVGPATDRDKITEVVAHLWLAEYTANGGHILRLDYGRETARGRLLKAAFAAADLGHTVHWNTPIPEVRTAWWDCTACARSVQERDGRLWGTALAGQCPGVPTYATIDGTQVPLPACDWVLWDTCGCPVGWTLAVSLDGQERPAEEDAWKALGWQYPAEDLHVELVTRDRYCTEIYPLMCAGCPHRTGD